MHYDLVRVTYRPVERWQTGRVQRTESLRSFGTGRTLRKRVVSIPPQASFNKVGCLSEAIRLVTTGSLSAALLGISPHMFQTPLPTPPLSSRRCAAVAGSSPCRRPWPPRPAAFSANRPAVSRSRRRSSARSTRFCSISPSRSSTELAGLARTRDLRAPLARRLAAGTATRQRRSAGCSSFYLGHEHPRRVRAARLAHRPRAGVPGPARIRRAQKFLRQDRPQPAPAAARRAAAHPPAARLAPPRARGRTAALRQSTLLVFWLAGPAVLMSYTMSGVGKLGGALCQLVRLQPNAFAPGGLGALIAQRLLQTAFHQPARRLDHPSPVADVARHARRHLPGTFFARGRVPARARAAVGGAAHRFSRGHVTSR